MNAADQYLHGRINYGGELVSRGDLIQRWNANGVPSAAQGMYLMARSKQWRESPCFYVSIKKGKDYRFIAGPFPTRGDAEKQVSRATSLAVQLDPSASFCSFGVSRLPDGWVTGILNDRLGITIED